MVITVGNNMLNCNFFKILLLPNRHHSFESDQSLVGKTLEFKMLIQELKHY